MAQEVFRFVTLQKVTPRQQDQAAKNILLSSSGQQGHVSNLMGELKKTIVANKADKTKVEKVLKDFSTSTRIIRGNKQLAPELNQYTIDLNNKKYDAVLAKKTEIAGILPKIKTDKQNLADSIVYFSFGLQPATRGIMAAFKTFVTLEKIVSAEISTGAQIARELNKEVIIAHEISACYKALAEAEPAKTKGKTPAQSTPQNKVKTVQALRKIYEEVSSLKEADLELKAAANGKTIRLVKNTSFNKMKTETREVYRAVARRSNTEEYDVILYGIEIELETALSPEALGGTAPFVSIFGSTGFYQPGLIGIIPPDVMQAYKNMHGAYVKVYGIAGFEVLKQVWDRYEPGEIAHIENVMNGENKMRKHVKTDESETEEEVFSETIEANENELETTDRFELQSEIAKMHQEQKSFDFGVTVTADGGWGSIESTLNLANSSEDQNSSNLATQMAKETVERAVNRINKTASERKRNRVMRKVVETNRHELSGNKTDGSHTVGIYRWVDKIYKAWTENIGQRMVLEFSIPEPARFYLFYKLNKVTGVDMPLEPMVARLEYNNIIDSIGEAESAIEKVKLSPEYITRYNYLKFAELYKIRGIEPPPPIYMMNSFDVKEEFFINSNNEEKKDENSIKTGNIGVKAINKNLTVPKGYVPREITCDLMATFSKTSIQNGKFIKKTFTQADSDPWYENVGDFFAGEELDTAKVKDATKDIVFDDRKTFERLITSVNGQVFVDAIHLDATGPNTSSALSHERYYFKKPLDYTPSNLVENLSISFQARGMQLISGTVEIKYLLSENAFTEWQVRTYEQIMAAYYELKQEADQKAAQQRIRQGVVINGQNPTINKEVVDTEMKKHCIDFLYQDRFIGAAQSYEQANGSLYGDTLYYRNWPQEIPKYPEFNYSESQKQAKVIEFLEQAFEWPRMMYMLYPYFWGQKENWLEKMDYNDPDPLFKKFLTAGASRVVVPVRPGFERAIGNFLYNFGKLWDSTEPPPIPEWATPEGADTYDYDTNGGPDTFLTVIEQLKEEAMKNSAECPPDNVEVLKVRIPTSLVWLDKKDQLPFVNELCNCTKEEAENPQQNQETV